MNLGTSHNMGLRVCHYNTFGKVLDVFSKWVVKGEELSMLAERRKLATHLQQNVMRT
jgi:hypothetical protein